MAAQADERVVDTREPFTTRERVTTAGGNAEVVTTVLTNKVTAPEPEGTSCGVTTFQEVEDRPMVVERVVTEVVHRPVEKEFVTEMRLVRERALATSTEVLSVTTRVIDEVTGSKCPTTFPFGQPI